MGLEEEGKVRERANVFVAVCVCVRETERRARKWEGTNEKGKEKIINRGREVNMGDVNISVKNSVLLDIAFKFPEVGKE